MANPKCLPRLPWPKWAEESGLPGGFKSSDNWHAFERWAQLLLDECITGGGAPIYCGTFYAASQPGKQIAPAATETSAPVAVTIPGANTRVAIQATVDIYSEHPKNVVVGVHDGSNYLIGPTVDAEAGTDYNSDTTITVTGTAVMSSDKNLTIKVFNNGGFNVGIMVAHLTAIVGSTTGACETLWTS